MDKIFEIDDNYVYVDSNSVDIVGPDNTINSVDYLESHNYKWFVYLKNDIQDFSKGSVVIAENVDNEMLYFDEFEHIVKPKFRHTD